MNTIDMNTTDGFDDSIALVAVDFQNEMRVAGRLEEANAVHLRTEAFPMSAPPALREAPDYGGLKVWAQPGGRVCIARFLDRQRTDAYQRAIPSATVLVFDRHLFRAGFRNLPALDELLIDASVGSGTIDKRLPVLRSIYDEASPFDSEEQLDAFLVRQGTDYERVAAAMGLLIEYGHLVVFCPDRPAGIRFISALYALAPLELLEATTWCTYAYSVDASHEDVVVHPGRLSPPEPASWLDKLKVRMQGGKAGDQVCMDIANGAVLGTHKPSSVQRLAERAVREIRENDLGLSGSFDDRFELIQGILGCACRRAPCDPAALLPAGLASDDIAARLELFVRDGLTG